MEKSPTSVCGFVTFRHTARGDDARKRWRLLARALLRDDGGRDCPSEVSVRRFSTFDIICPRREGEDGWFDYATADSKHTIAILRPPRFLTPTDLTGFNNTGNVCVWPSEETLSVYVLSHLDLFTDKTVLELGGGMSCMAGLMTAKYARPAHVTVTDGNAKSVENVRAILKRNRLEDIVSCSVLRWETARRNHHQKDVSLYYDVVLIADCLFFDEAREDLIRTTHVHLSDKGVAYVMAPQRGDTLDRFVSMSESFGFICERFDAYDETVQKRHTELLETDRYEPDLHYPVLLVLRKNGHGDLG